MLRRAIREKKVFQILLCMGVLLPGVLVHAQNAKQGTTTNSSTMNGSTSSAAANQSQQTNQPQQASQQDASKQSASADSSDMNATAAATQEQKKWTKEELFSPDFINKLSLTHGYLIAKSLNNPVLQLNMDAVIQGMQNEKNGVPSPLSEQDYEEALAQIQEYAFQDMADKNLKQANDFLKENAKKKGVISIDPGKLQYTVLKIGTGAPVTDDTIPSVQYKGSYLDGTVFGSSEKTGPVSIPLDQTIPGFRKGVMGMKVGEKRRIFIHPDLGYGVYGQLLPNALLVFDIEVMDVKPKPKETQETKDQKDANNVTADAESDQDEAEDLDEDIDDDEDHDGHGHK
jgi:peptidylprolyl isomerase